MEVSQNLLLTLLAVTAAAVPFAQRDWPTPRPSAQTLPTPVPNLLLTTLAPAAPTPFKQAEWPVPARGLVRQVDAPPNLLLAPGIAPPFIPDDLQGPRANTTRPLISDPPNLLLGTLTPAAAPFVQHDWPLGVRRGQLPVDVPLNLLGTTLVPAPAAAPFRQTDWPAPMRWISAPPGLQPLNLLLTTLTPPVTTGVFRDLTTLGSKLSSDISPDPILGGRGGW